MIRFFAVSRHGGTVDVYQVQPGYDIETDCLDKLHPDTRAQIASWREMTQAEFEAYRELNATLKGGLPEAGMRLALRDPGSGKLECDMPAARELWRKHMRRARQPMLDDLDRRHNRAVGQRKQTEADTIEAARQVLRDVTADPAIEAATTPDALRAVWPDALAQRPT